jgi:hypothetical protein
MLLPVARGCKAQQFGGSMRRARFGRYAPESGLFMLTLSFVVVTHLGPQLITHSSRATYYKAYSILPTRSLCCRTHHITAS